MASVTFPIAFGGDGSTITDDANATTGLANGGHRARFVASLAQAVAVMSGAVSQATNQVSLATTQAGNALNSANAAAASAASAVASPATTATSSTSLTIATGAQALTIQTGKTIAVGMAVMIANAAAPAAQYMHGIVTAYTPASGALTVNVDFVFGSGTVSNWSISLSAPVDVTRAPLASPALTGTPTAPTAALGDSSAQIANTAWVKANLPRGRIFYSGS